jgi:hypothetical protein
MKLENVDKIAGRVDQIITSTAEYTTVGHFAVEAAIRVAIFEVEQKEPTGKTLKALIAVALILVPAPARSANTTIEIGPPKRCVLECHNGLKRERCEDVNGKITYTDMFIIKEGKAVRATCGD